MTDNPYKHYFELMPAYLTILDRDLGSSRQTVVFARISEISKGGIAFRSISTGRNVVRHCPTERTFRDGLRHEIEEKFINNLGHEVFLLINTTPITNEAGEITHVMKMATDITELKLLQNQLRDSRERYRKLFEEVPCYISIQDPDLQIVDANRRLREDFGASPGDKCHQIYMHRPRRAFPAS